MGRVKKKLWGFLLFFVSAYTQLNAQTPEDHAFLSTVQITNSGGRQFCSGVLVSSQSVLTAAHCLYHKKTGTERTIAQLRVVPGKQRRSTSLKTGTERRVKKIIKHPGFNEEKTENDIAILQLEKPFEANNVPISTIRIVDTVPENGSNCLICGWGCNGQNQADDIFKCANVNLISKNDCQKFYLENVIVDGMLCALSENGGACKGDSGGPLICNGLLAGLISTGEDCEKNEYPGIFTNISQYREWIIENLK